MRIDILDCISQGGSGGYNEDASGWTERAAWVVDGATSLDESRNWERTSGRWAATEVNILLAGLNAEGNGAPEANLDAAGALEQVVDGLSRGWEGVTAKTDSSRLLPPVCSLGMVRLTPGRDGLELVTVGDCAVVWQSSSRRIERVIADTRFAADEADISRRFPDGGATSELIARRLDYISGRSGSWVLSTNRRVADSLEPLLVEDPSDDLFLIASDGFARAVELSKYCGSWEELLDDAIDSGLAWVLWLLRDAEFRGELLVNGKLKDSDDATALLLRVVD